MALPLTTALAVLGAVPPALARPTTNQAVDDATSPFVQGKPVQCPKADWQQAGMRRTAEKKEIITCACGSPPPCRAATQDC